MNKMDEKTVAYSESRYNEIKTEVTSFLKKTGFKTDIVKFIPISGF